MSKLTKNERIDRLVACLRTQGIKMRELETRLSTQEKWSDYADEMLTELNHALPDPEHDAKCEENAVAVEESLARHAVRLGLKKPELTGSDLCRAMLERGDKYVLCFVSDFSDDYAANQAEKINLITHTEGKSICAKSARWKYAVPINQQTGEPLTASEVGL